MWHCSENTFFIQQKKVKNLGVFPWKSAEINTSLEDLILICIFFKTRHVILLSRQVSEVSNKIITDFKATYG